MRIAWLCSHLLIPTGGTRFIHEVTRRIARRAEVTLYCERAGDDIRQRFESSGVPVREIGRATSTSAMYWMGLRRHLREELEVLRGTIRSEDAIISHMFPMNVLANGLTERAVQYCYEPFAFFWCESMIRPLPLPKRLFCRYLARRYGRLDIEHTRRSARVVTLNSITRQQIRRVYGVESVVSLAGVDTSFFRSTPDEALAARYAGKRILVHGTDYSPVKASDLVVRAMPAIVRGVPGAHLLITNTRDDPDGRARLEALARRIGVREHITFLGFLDFPEVPRYYTLAEVVIQPAFAADAGTASMNLAVKEAMACETAVVRAAITDEDAEHGVSGMLVRPDDPQAIAEATIDILSDPARAEAMGRAGRGRIVELYDWDRTAGVIFDAIAEVNHWEQRWRGS